MRGLDIKPSEYTHELGSITDREFVDHCMPGVRVVHHTATLHKPHVATHNKQDFIDTNVSGTLTLLESAIRNGVGAFVFTSTTSVFGNALLPSTGSPAIWVTEELRPVPKNIYGVTKAAAEDLCELMHRKHGLNCIVLRTSRFFPEEDDDPTARVAFSDENLKANEFLFRRVDVSDVVEAHLHAAEKVREIGFNKYIVSATTPFSEDDLSALRVDPVAVVERYVPGFQRVYRDRDWKLHKSIDRVYVNAAARRDLGWEPVCNFAAILKNTVNGQGALSPLAQAIGTKGYHEQAFIDGPYPTESE